MYWNFCRNDRYCYEFDPRIENWLPLLNQKHQQALIYNDLGSCLEFILQETRIKHYFGAKMVPSHSPKPIRFPSLSQCPVIFTESPFFKNFRISPSSKLISRVPFQLKSRFYKRPIITAPQIRVRCLTLMSDHIWYGTIWYGPYDIGFAMLAMNHRLP